MIRDGVPIPRRGANKKAEYAFLDDLDWLYEQLMEKSMGELAREYNVPYNCIRHRVVELFPPEWIENIKRQRKFHKKRKTR